ncbi:MAG: NAD(P)-dependent oxidoreductase [Pseudomonadota bacterium]|nr:NAD(P)-dependent oxidoreductase [Pseudomonadota bacterium]
MTRRRRVILTGAGGRIGRAIAFRLARDYEVIGLDRAPASVVQVIGDVADFELLERTFKGAAAIIHTAALHAPHVGIASEAEFQRINVEGTRHVIAAAREAGIRRLVFTSTTALYGKASRRADGAAAWIDEDTPPEPVTVYHRSKLEAESLLEEAASPSLSVRILRMSRCFPEPAPTMAAYRLHRGVDARDVAEAHALALANDGPACQTFIISGATPFRPEDCAALGRDAPSVIAARAPILAEAFTARGWELPARIDRIYVPHKAETVLGWRPRFGFEAVLSMLDQEISEVLPPTERAQGEE